MPYWDDEKKMLVIDDTVADADWPKRTNDVIDPIAAVVKKRRKMRDVLGEWMFGKAEPRDADGDGMVYDGTLLAFGPDHNLPLLIRWLNPTQPQFFGTVE